MCPDSVCAAAANQGSFKMICQCKDASGNAIPGCTPQNATFPVQESACVNSKTKETKPTQDCRTLMGQSDDWNMGQCACCCSN